MCVCCRILHIYTAKGQREYAFAAAEKLQELGALDAKEHRGKVGHKPLPASLICLLVKLCVSDTEPNISVRSSMRHVHGTADSYLESVKKTP